MNNKNTIKDPKAMIVKVQNPLFSTKEPPPVLIYNEDRSFLEEFPLSKELLDMFGGDDKQYWSAYFQKDGTLFLDFQVEDQEW